MVNRTFEFALIKIHNGQEATLSSIKKKAIKHLMKLYMSAEITERDIGMSIADKLLKWKRISNQSTPSKYLDKRFVVATSNVCEWPFSVARSTMGERRKGMLPSNFESLDFYMLTFNYGVLKTFKVLILRNSSFEKALQFPLLQKINDILLAPKKI